MARLRNFRELALLAALGLSLLLNILARSENGARISEIQRSRIDATLTSCREENQRNHAARLGLERFVGHNPPKVRLSAAQARKQRGQLAEFVNALVPIENCNARTRRLTSP